jgi:copper chaperone CopZ
MMKKILILVMAAAFAAGAAMAAEKTWIFKVEGLDCAKCDKAVAGKLMKIQGVSKAEALHEKGTISVTFDNAKVKGPGLRKDIEAMKGTCKPIKVTGRADENVKTGASQPAASR